MKNNMMLKDSTRILYIILFLCVLSTFILWNVLELSASNGTVNSKEYLNKLLTSNTTDQSEPLEHASGMQLQNGRSRTEKEFVNNSSKVMFSGKHDSINAQHQHTLHNGGSHNEKKSVANRSEITSSGSKLILLWTTLYNGDTWGMKLGQDHFVDWSCPEQNCRFSNDKAELNKADAVMFHFSEFQDDAVPSRGKENQIYVFFWVEAPMYTNFGKLDLFQNVFNLTMTYNPASDIVVPYGAVVPTAFSSGQGYLTASDLKEKDSLVAWVISHCGKEHSQRNQYVEELQKFIGVDIYGACGKPCPEDQGKCFSYLEKRYKFYIAFENSVCKGYVTEKLFRTLLTKMVPIVLGGADYSTVVPHEAVISVMNYGSPEKLAEYLKYLDQNDDEYMEYFTWKDKYRVIDRPESRAKAYCRLCEILHDPTYHFKSHFDVVDFWSRDACLVGNGLSKALNISVSV